MVLGRQRAGTYVLIVMSGTLDLTFSFVPWCCYSTSVCPMLQLADTVIPLATQTVTTTPDTVRVNTWLVVVLMMANTASLG